MDAVAYSHSESPGLIDSGTANEWHESLMGVSLDHAVWFHRPVRAEDWLLLDLTGHGMLGTRGLASGPAFQGGSHVATIAQEGLLRRRKPGS
jgi:acyl-CoA thioesterase-2